MKHDPAYQKLHKYAKIVKQRLADKKNGLIKKTSNNVGEGSPRINVKHVPIANDEVQELDEDEWVSQDYGSKKPSETNLGVPLFTDEEGHKTPHAKSTTQARRKLNNNNNFLAPSEFDATAKSMENNFAGSPTKDSVQYLSPRLPGSPRNNNGLPPGDKEPLEDKFVVPPLKDSAWMSVAEPLPEASSPKEGSDNEGAEPGNIFSPSTNIKSAGTAQPLMSPAVNDNNKYTPRRASVFRRDLDAVKPETMDKINEEEDDEKEKGPGFRGCMVNVFGVIKRIFFKSSHTVHASNQDFEDDSLRRASSRGGRPQLQQGKSMEHSINEKLTSNPTFTNKHTMKGHTEQHGSSHSQVLAPSFLMQEDPRGDGSVDPYDESSNLESQRKKARRMSLRKSQKPMKKGKL